MHMYFFGHSLIFSDVFFLKEFLGACLGFFSMGFLRLGLFYVFSVLSLVVKGIPTIFIRYATSI